MKCEYCQSETPCSAYNFGVPCKNEIEQQKIKLMNNLNITELLKKRQQPIATQFIQTKKVDPKPFIKPLKGPKNYNEKDRVKVEHWLSFCSIGTQIIETGTKALSNMGLIHSRDGVFDLITAFKQLNIHFNGNENYDAKERIIDDFVFTFLSMTDEQQKRIINFQESILNKKH